MDPNDYPDGAFEERAHDLDELVDSADLYRIDRDEAGLVIGLPDEDDEPTPLFSRSRVMDLLENHLDRGGLIRMEAAQ